MNTPDPRIPDGEQVPQAPAHPKPLRKRLWFRVTGATLAAIAGLIIAMNVGSHPVVPAAATTPASPPATSAPAAPHKAVTLTPAQIAHAAHLKHEAHAGTAPAPATQAPAPAPAAPAAAAPAAPASQPPAAPAGPTASQQQALDAAQGYLSDGQGFSQAGLIQQLTSSYGNGFSTADATWAVDHSGADWYAQAVICAKGYMSDGQGFSRSGLIDQMTSQYGSQFTYAQASYAASQVGL